MRIAIFSRPLFGLLGLQVAEILQAEIAAPTAAITLSDSVDFPDIYRELRKTRPQLPQLSPIAELANLIGETAPVLLDTRSLTSSNTDLVFQKLSSKKVLTWQAEIQKLHWQGYLRPAANPEDIAIMPETNSARLVAVISEMEKTLSFTGLKGVSAKLGFTQQLARREIIELDQQAKAWLAEIGLTDSPGYGAANGYAVLAAALGGRIISAFEYLVEIQSGLELLKQADLALLLTNRFDFGYHGGEVVKWALANAQIPVVVAAPAAEMSRRESRNLGIEEVWDIGNTITSFSVFAKRFSQFWT